MTSLLLIRNLRHFADTYAGDSVLFSPRTPNEGYRGCCLCLFNCHSLHPYLLVYLLGLLSLMRMARTGIYFKFAVHIASELGLGKHAPYDPFDQTLRTALKDLLVGEGLKSAGVKAMCSDCGLQEFFACESTFSALITRRNRRIT